MQFKNTSKSDARVRIYGNSPSPQFITVGPGETREFPPGVSKSIMRRIAPMLKVVDAAVGGASSDAEPTPVSARASRPVPVSKRGC